MNAIHLGDQNLKNLGGFTAFVAGDRTWHSTVVQDRATRIASGLVALGLLPGDRVLLCLPNGADLAISWRAVLRCGGVTVVAHHDAPLQRIEHLVAETQPTAIVTSAEYSPSESTVRHRIQIEPGEERPGWISLDRLATEPRPLVEPVWRSDDEVACIEYTSGTTGAPKGSVTRHGALAAKLQSSRTRYHRWRRPARHLSVLPMSSSFGRHPLFGGLVQKCTYYFVDRFDPEQVLLEIQRHRIQRISLVPAMCEAILAVPDIARFDLSSLRTVACGGAIVSADLIRRFQDVLGIRLVVQYGMTGVGGVSRTSPDSKAGSVGRPPGHLKAKVVDGEGRELPSGEIGELILNLSEEIAVDYWNLEDSTAPRAKRSGPYRTGDLVRFDSDGELFVVGRKDDLIIQGGHNVHAAMVAEIVQQIPDVRECAVVGIANEFLGQEVVACVALREGAKLTAGEIIAHCRGRLDPPAVPTRVWFINALPRNEAGKVKTHELRYEIGAAHGVVQETMLAQQLRAAAGSDRHDLLREEVLRILNRILGASGAPAASAGAGFVESGLDSLGAVELTHALSEVIGRPVPATLTYTYPTVDDACSFLLELMGWRGTRPTTPMDPLASPAIDAEDLRLERFFSQSQLDAARQLVPGGNLRRDPDVAFLTGANGFLGRFLALEILERLPPEGKLYCLVRSPDNATALERFQSAYQSDRSLRDSVDRHLRDDRLVVLRGDLTQPRFGLSDEAYDRLCREVDCIVHNGAVVDHMLSYRELFAPNVLGTVEILRFALAARVKPINYVSTIAARAPSRRELEHAAGYSMSKWASEKLLRELHDRVRVPVRIYRPSHIMAHSSALGQINVQDTLTRLLQGIVVASLAPRSFYAPGHANGAAYYDGLPVDAVARSIAALSLAGEVGRPKYSEHNVVNAHRDVSLDAIADWVRSAGYDIERIDDYATWYETFKSRLGSLSRPQRSQSLLPLIHAWKQPARAAGGRHFSKSDYRSLFSVLRAVGTAEPIDTPRITEEFIHKCLKDMHLMKLI